MISVGYDFGDWLLKKRILKYIKFYSPQQENLEVILDDFMAWHKANALNIYAQDVLKLKKRVEKIKQKPIEAKEIAEHLNLFRSRYFESFDKLSTMMIPLLSELKSEQVDRTKVLLGRKLDELKERNKILKSELLRQLESKWIENLEDWFGRLNPEQKKLIARESASAFISPLVVWSRQGQRTNNFTNIFDEKDIPKRKLGLKVFFQDWKKDDFYLNWRRDVAGILSTFMKTLTDKQRLHLLKKLDDTESIIKKLID